MNKQFYFSVKALVIENNHFLALYHFVNGVKKWDLPGGRMEFGESAEETLKREVQEELGVDVTPIKLVDTWNAMFKDEFQITGIIYYSQLASDEITLSDEHDGYQWINIDRFNETFNNNIFAEKMKTWNWDVILDDKQSIVNQIEEVRIDQLIPNNLFLNQSKIDKIKVDYQDKHLDLPPILVGRIDGELALIDGHSRTYVAYKAGYRTINAVIKDIADISGPEALYRTIHKHAKVANINTISDLSNRILRNDEHQKQWVGYCKKLVEQLNIEEKE